MDKAVYKELLEVMKSRGGAYSGADIPEFYAMVEEMFTPAEARVNNAMPKGPFTSVQMAEIMGMNQKECEEILEGMANRGLCRATNKEDSAYYVRAPFMPGILEFIFMSGKATDREKKLAKLIHAYEKACDATAPVNNVTRYPTARVITVDRSINAKDTVHTFDQVQHYIGANDYIAVGTCYCRHTALLRGEDIHGMPANVCMQFGDSAQFAVERLGARKITREEAMEVLKQSEEAGLIHMSQNTADGVGFICNCDRWHCGVVSQALKSSKPALTMNSGFVPSFDPDECVACETCIERCPSEALAMGSDDVPEVNNDGCFGCAACATGCSSDAISMVHRPDFIAPPKDAMALREAMKAHASQK
ncbi:MAG: 4Fe-4S binding protein [Proteobacteria bacterium]|nr:4Fe-4S binding protein [Pseudomonadota bacterium]MBU4472469.1 4Fe-4S binding protein [Pseudomonadota bacterium]MCG2751296.1 4Fe-4S binding protein [Desulfobacteraceae bacterium]